jgi:hypothetical protein
MFAYIKVNTCLYTPSQERETRDSHIIIIMAFKWSHKRRIIWENLNRINLAQDWEQWQCQIRIPSYYYREDYSWRICQYFLRGITNTTKSLRMYDAWISWIRWISYTSSLIARRTALRRMGKEGRTWRKGRMRKACRCYWKNCWGSRRSKHEWKCNTKIYFRGKDYAIVGLSYFLPTPTLHPYQTHKLCILKTFTNRGISLPSPLYT